MAARAGLRKRPAKNVEIVNDGEQEDEPVVKRGRTRAKRETQVAEEQENEPVVKRGRTRAKRETQVAEEQEDEPVVKRGRIRAKRETQVAEEQEDEPVVKRGRIRAKRETEVADEPEVTIKGRGKAKKDADAKLKTKAAAETKQTRGRKQRIKVKQEANDEEEDAQEPSTSHEVEGKIKGKSKASKKDVKEETQEDQSHGKTPGGTKSKSKASKKKSGSSKGKENIDTNNAPVKSGVERVVVLKGRAPVDALCPIAKQSHVFEDDDAIWDCMLNQTNIQFNNNKYYLIQLLKDDESNSYSVWMRWGRVGANGQNSLKPCASDLEKAKDTFMKKFSDKTKNDWLLRDLFEKVPGKYDLLAMDYSQGEDSTDSKAELEKAKEEHKKIDCKLEIQVKALIELICDIRKMEETVVEMKYDAQKAPLGKLTTDQIKAGYLALKHIDDLIQSSKYKQMDLVHACNDFYTRIPHYFGMKVPPLIGTTTEVQEKMALLEALGDIQAALSVLEQPLDITIHPVDQHYNRLKCDISPLKNDSEDFKIIKKYLLTTHGKTHSQYSLKLLEVFSCRKESEYERFKNVGNSKLLWHGSRMSNWAGILSQGLRIAPPEAPSTGYMFGKGIYFADMSSKSANYCWATERHNTGLLLLSEVALGKTNELVNADYNASKLPKGYNSVKGCGKIAPSDTNSTTLSDGTVVPMGPSVKTGTNNSKGYTLMYNEYIVYDPAQVRTRYLLKIQFDFK